MLLASASWGPARRTISDSKRLARRTSFAAALAWRPRRFTIRNVADGVVGHRRPAAHSSIAANRPASLACRGDRGRAFDAQSGEGVGHTGADGNEVRAGKTPATLFSGRAEEIARRLHAGQDHEVGSGSGVQAGLPGRGGSGGGRSRFHRPLRPGGSVRARDARARPLPLRSAILEPASRSCRELPTGEQRLAVEGRLRLEGGLDAPAEKCVPGSRPDCGGAQASGPARREERQSKLHRAGAHEDRQVVSGETRHRPPCRLRIPGRCDLDCRHENGDRPSSPERGTERAGTGLGTSHEHPQSPEGRRRGLELRIRRRRALRR